MRVPNTYVIIFSVLLLCAVATWFIPGGVPQTWQVFSALFEGFSQQAGIIAFVLIIGGAFWVVNSTKAVDAGITRFIAKASTLERFSLIRKLGIGNIVIVLVMLLFGVFGAVFGMSEETIAFVAVVIPLAKSLGYDEIVGVCMVYVAAHVGFAGAMLNPFTVGIAQEMSGLPLFSGIEYRTICWVVLMAIAIICVLCYASKVKKTRLAALVSGTDSGLTAASGTGAGAGAGAGSGSGSSSGSGSGSGSCAGMTAGLSSGSGMTAGSGSGSGASAGLTAGAGTIAVLASDSDYILSSDQDVATGTNDSSVSGSGASAGMSSDSAIGMASASASGSASGTASGTGSGTGSGAGSLSGSETGEGSCAGSESVEAVRETKAGLNAWISFAVIAVALALFSVFYASGCVVKIGQGEFAAPWLLWTADALFVLSSLLSLRSSTQMYILNLLMFTILFMVVGVMGYGWYLPEICALFMALGIAAGIASGNSADNIAKEFIAGAKDIFSAALVIGFAAGIIYILKNGNAIDPMLNSMADALEGAGKTGALGMMYGIQTFLNLFIPSASAKAAVTMPIMAPFSDMIGLSRQATVLAFQFGDGFTNMITPCSGVLMAVLSVAKIPYAKWFKWVWKFILLLLAVGFLLLLPAALLEIPGF